MPKFLIKKLLREHNIKPSKRLGQNFLVDKSVLKKIIDASNISSKDTIVEIGPGLGNLTVELAKKAKRVIAIEKDKIFCRLLKEILKDERISNVKVINQDVLKISNFQFLISNKISNSKFKIVANLPYYITSPVIRKFLELKKSPKELILMVQKEVAQRICAKPPKMNLLAIAVQFYAVPKIISYVSKNAFYPKPKVDSAIIKIETRNNTELNGTDTEQFFKLVKAGFSSRRKMLKNNLKIDKSIIENLGLKPGVRAENLSVKTWLKIYKVLYLKQ